MPFAYGCNGGIGIGPVFLIADQGVPVIVQILDQVFDIVFQRGLGFFLAGEILIGDMKDGLSAGFQVLDPGVAGDNARRQRIFRGIHNPLFHHAHLHIERPQHGGQADETDNGHTVQFC